MKSYRCLLFDLDGTLTYSHHGIFNCIRYAFEKMGKTPPNENQMRPAVGPPLLDSFQNLFGFSLEDAEKCVAFYRERYSTVGLFENEPIAGALELLQGVKGAGYLTALATSKPAVFANAIAEKFGFSPYLDHPAVATLQQSDKRWVIERTMENLGVQKEECLMIGDTLHDVEGARKAGVDCAAVRCGYSKDGELELAEPKFIFDDLFALREFLLKNAEER